MGLVQCVVYLHGLVGVVWLYPEIENVPVERVVPGAGSASHRVLMTAAFVCAFLRSFVVAGLEVATALLLEDEYSCDGRWNGVAIGLTFGTSFIASKFFSHFDLNALV